MLLIPSQIVYAMDSLLTKARFHQAASQAVGTEDFDSPQAKSVALERIFGLGNVRLATTLQRVRSLSGLVGKNAVTPPGLGNWDNSCYQNSVLQALSALPSFDKMLQRNLELIDSKTNAPMHQATKDFIAKLNNMTNNGRTFWTPSVLKSMSSWQQQDAQEYFSKVVDDIDREIASFGKTCTAVAGLETRTDSVRTPVLYPACARNTFEGLLAQRVCCKACGYSEGINLQQFNCLTVNLGGGLEYDIGQCLDHYTELEEIEGVECVKCTILRVQAHLERLLSKNTDISLSPEFYAAAEARLTLVNEVLEEGALAEPGVLKRCNVPAKSKVSSTKSRQEVVARSPQDLVIHVNRSIFDTNGNQKKNTAEVRFPAVLNLSKWCLGARSEDDGKDVKESWVTDASKSMLPSSCHSSFPASTRLYQLRAVITHFGRHENGHYVAYRKRSQVLEDCAANADTPGKTTKEEWYCCNDELVSTISEDDVLAKGGVFMLFYEAIELPLGTDPVGMEGVAVHLNHEMLEKNLSHPSSPSETEIESEPKAAVGEQLSAPSPAMVQPVLEEPKEPQTSTRTSEEYGDRQKSENNVPISQEPAPASGRDARGSKLGGGTPTSSTSTPSIAPIMRTSSGISPSTMRKDRRSSAFNVTPHSIVPAV